MAKVVPASQRKTPGTPPPDCSWQWLGLYYGVDRYLDPIMGRWSVLFSGTGTKKQKDGFRSATPLGV